MVLAASYEARAFGVRAGMAGGRARRLCPSLRFVGGHFASTSDSVIRSSTSSGTSRRCVERISIDEAFLDVAGTVHLFGRPERHRRCHSARGCAARSALAVSVGVARTKHLAKVASQVAKPDGLIVVDPEREAEFLNPLPVELLWGVGPATRTRLAGMGIRTIGELAGHTESAPRAAARKRSRGQARHRWPPTSTPGRSRPPRRQTSSRRTGRARASSREPPVGSLDARLPR